MSAHSWAAIVFFAVKLILEHQSWVHLRNEGMPLSGMSVWRHGKEEYHVDRRVTYI